MTHKEKVELLQSAYYYNRNIFLKGDDYNSYRILVWHLADENGSDYSNGKRIETHIRMKGYNFPLKSEYIDINKINFSLLTNEVDDFESKLPAYYGR